MPLDDEQIGSAQQRFLRILYSADEPVVRPPLEKPSIGVRIGIGIIILVLAAEITALAIH